MRLTSFSATGNLPDPPPPLPSVCGHQRHRRLPHLPHPRHHRHEEGDAVGVLRGAERKSQRYRQHRYAGKSLEGLGKTWSKPLVIWDDGENTCGNPCPVVDQQTGVIWLLMTWNLGSDHEREIMAGTSADVRHVYVTHSEDDGLTWTPAGQDQRPGAATPLALVRHRSGQRDPVDTRSTQGTSAHSRQSLGPLRSGSTSLPCPRLLVGRSRRHLAAGRYRRASHERVGSRRIAGRFDPAVDAFLSWPPQSGGGHQHGRWSRIRTCPAGRCLADSRVPGEHPALLLARRRRRKEPHPVLQPGGYRAHGLDGAVELRRRPDLAGRAS